MKSKGISPLIAAVLLIAFTMAVASLFAQWAPQLFQSAQGDTINQSEQLTGCTEYNLGIESANATHVTVSQTSGDDGVGNVSVTWYYSNGTEPVLKYLQIDRASGFGQANNSNNDGELDRVEATSLQCDTVTATYSQ